MTLSDYRETYSWQAAIALGPKLIQLAEQLPASEQAGLGLQLRDAMTELPAAIGRDLVSEGGQHDRFGAVMRLVGVIELIERIYPALDAAEVRDAVDVLSARLGGPTFNEQVPAKTPAASAAEPAEIDNHDTAPAPASVPVLDAASAAPNPAPAPSPAPVSVPVMPPAPNTPLMPDQQVPNVHPDSV